MWIFNGEARVYTVFPFFHLAGFLSLTLQTIFMNASPVLGPPHLLPDTALLKLVMQHQKLRSMFLPPAVIEGLLHEPNGIDAFKNLDFLVYSGAPFSPVNGDRLSKVVEIISPFGSTEVYPQPELAPMSSEDWAYHEFNPNIKHEMELYDATEGTYELVIIVDETTKDTAAAYHNLPGITEYHTKDLFVKHPQKPELFRYYGRRDDIIVLANGEKFNPIPLEVNVQNHPSLEGAFVIGNGRRQAALLVEPKESLDDSGRQSLLEELWPRIVDANELIPGQGRIQKSKFLCSLPNKPFTRTGKGTIVRKLTEEAYKYEIERLYSDIPLPSPSQLANLDLQPTLNYEMSDVIRFCRTIISTAFPIAATIDGDGDFVAHGLDSEQTVEIVSALKSHLRARTDKSVDWISPRTLFRSSTVNSLSRVVQDFLNKHVVPEEDSRLSRSRLVEEAVAEYTKGLPGARPDELQDGPLDTSSTTVALIGSSGYLGSRLMVVLISDPAISRIYCLNRSVDARAKQEASLLEHHHVSPELLEKLVFVAIDIEKPALGIAPEVKDRVLNEVDVIVLNAWHSNFVLPLRFFRPFLKATLEVVRLAASSRMKSRVVFVSSLASVGAMARGARVPEALVSDPLAAFNNGYAQSKLAAERVLAAGSERCGFPLSVVRVTQIGGPTDGRGGRWAEQGWIAALARTAKAIAVVPSSGPAVDWLPVNTVAEVLRREVIGGRGTEAIRFVNALHPHPQPWSVLAGVLQQTLGVDSTAPLQDWIQMVRDVRRVDRGGDKLPAVPLLDHYEEEYGASDALEFESSLAKDGSGVEVPALDEKVLKSWIDDWEL